MKQNTYSSIFTDTKELYFKNVNFYFSIAIIMALLTTSLEVVNYFDYKSRNIDYIDDIVIPREDNPLKEYPSPSMSTNGISFIMGLALAALNIVIVIHSFSFIKKKKQSLNESYNKFSALIIPIITTFIIAFFFLFGLLLLLIIPALIMGFYWCMSQNAILFRKKSNLEALRYSKALITDNWWRTVGYGILTGIIVAIAIMIPSIMLKFLVASKLSLISHLNIVLITQIFSYMGTFFSMVFFLHYFLVLEKEKNIKA